MKRTCSRGHLNLFSIIFGLSGLCLTLITFESLNLANAQEDQEFKKESESSGLTQKQSSAISEAQSKPPTPIRKVPLPPLPREISLSGVDSAQRELSFLGLFSSRSVYSNLSATGLLDDQLIGRLYGDNGSTTLDEGRLFFEQRALGFLTYQPTSVNGRARLKVGFEIDFTFGDSANTAGSNAGGAINGDQVNLQTKRLLVELDLKPNMQLVVGLQPLSDSAFNPTRADPYDLLNGGGRLMFWGTDAAGVSLFGKWGEKYARLSMFTLNLNEAAKADDVLLWMADSQFRLSLDFTLGAHAWLLSDRSGVKAGGVDSAIAEYTGATTLDLGPDQADALLTWIGVDLSYNRARRGGRISADLAAFVNIGRFDVLSGECRDGMGDLRCPRDQNGQTTPYDSSDADLLALLFDFQLGYRWGRGDWDAVTLGILYATGDNQPRDRVLSSPVTGNAFGTPGGLFAHHRMLLLFPDPRSVNRHVGLVYDPGNLGYGLQALTSAISGDIIAEVLNLKVGLGYAASAALPLDSGERPIGMEGNLELIYRIAPFFWIGAHAAVARQGRFLESADRVPVSSLPQGDRPWMSALSITWIQL